jgi:hypothetical protein
MTDVVCPFDNCDYSGPVGSVEAHISGSGGGEHRGEFGADHRADLVEQAEAKLNGDGWPPVEATESGDVTETDEGDDPRSTGAKETGAAPTSERSKVPPSKALIGASVLFALAAFTGSGAEAATEATTDTDADQDAEPDGGLIG